MTQETLNNDEDFFATLKRDAKKSLAQMQEETKKLKGSSFESDDRYWSLTTDKAGNGRAIIRFLPPVRGETSPSVKYFSHGFQVGSSYYIENCPTTLGSDHECPVCQGNSVLWKESGKDEDHPKKKIVRERKRKLHFVSNILVVEDDANPENNGKVFLFRYGKKIFEKINVAMNPIFKGEDPINPFDLWQGHDFVLKQSIVEGYPNFENSNFKQNATPVADNDEKIKAIFLAQHKLKPIVDPSNFKKYDELKRRYDRVLGIVSVAPTKTVSEQQAEDTPLPKSTSKAKTPEEFFADLAGDEDEEE